MADSTLLNLTQIDKVENDDFALIWDTSAVNENNNKKAKLEQIAEYVGSAGQVDFNISANSKAISVSAKKELIDGLVLSLTFLTEITGVENDVMTINYNSTGAKTIKVGKNGVISDFIPVNIEGTYKFLQAFTTLQCKYIEAQDCFLIIGNPLVLSDSSAASGYTIYADGKKVYEDVKDILDSDLNNYKKSGVYLNTQSTSFAHLPTTAVGVLQVITNENLNYITQIYITYHPWVYIRNFWNGTWGSWKRLDNV